MKFYYDKKKNILIIFIFTLFMIFIGLILVILIPMLLNLDVAYELLFVPGIMWVFMLMLVFADRNAYMTIDDDKISRKSFAGVLEVPWSDISKITYGYQFKQITFIVDKNRKVAINSTLMEYLEVRKLVLHHLGVNDKLHLLPKRLEKESS